VRRTLTSIALTFLCLVLVVPVILQQPETAQASASMSVGSNPTIGVGQDISVQVNVNTGGQSANAFEATFSYPSSLFDGVRGTYAGSICTLPISQPDPDGGTASISCGRPSGYTGSGLVATIVLHAKAPGDGSFGLSGCTVLANDGQGTDISGGCSGRSISVTGVPTPPPTPTPSPTPTRSPTPTPKPSNTTSPKPTTTPKVTPTPTPGGPGAPVAGSSTPPPTPPIDGPDAQQLPESTPLPDATESPSSAPQTEKRSIGQAIKDIFGSLGELKGLGGNLSGIVALMLTMIPFLLILFAIVFLGYRLYLLERRRRRTLDRLFELELSELASLEGKLDLLAEKGTKGRQEFKEEFQAVKENILRQIKPEYNKPVDAPKQKPDPGKPESK
jgi:hypothetical protein